MTVSLSSLWHVRTHSTISVNDFVREAVLQIHLRSVSTGGRELPGKVHLITVRIIHQYLLGTRF